MSEAKHNERMTSWGYKKRDVIKNGYYVVGATHPDKPNYSGNSRGRKRHLCASKKKNDKTLCNMLNDGWTFTESLAYPDLGWWDSWVDNGFCKVCIAKSSKGKKL